MGQHLLRDLDGLSKELLTMGAMVEEATNKAITAVTKRDKQIAAQVIEGDRVINDKENVIEEEALKILALHQPVAQDLRFIITALKINNDLERMADLAANICERARRLADLDPIPVPDDFNDLVRYVHEMVRDCLNSFVERDAETARRVCEADDKVDAINRGMYDQMQNLMRENPNNVEAAVSMISVSRHFERISDAATNIAEDVIFMTTGEIVRHKM